MQTLVRATANARKYILLTTNTHDVLQFDLQESIAQSLLNLSVTAPKSEIIAMKRNPLTLVIGILLIIIFGLLLFVFQVRTTEVAVVTTFGNPTRPITEPGAYFKWPWPIQKVWSFDKRVQNFEDRLTEGLTRDNFNLLTSVYVGWRITDPAAFFPKFASSADPIGEAERQLERLLGNAKSAVIGQASAVRFRLRHRQRGQFRGHRERNPDDAPVADPHQQLTVWRSSSSASSGCNCRRTSASRCSTG